MYVCFYVFRTRAWVPGGLGGRSRGAWAASPGLLGHLPEAPQGGSRAQTTRANLIPRAFKFAAKFMSILMSVFNSFGVDLGSLLGVIFGHVGAFFGPSWSRNRLRTVLSSKKRLLTKHYVFQYFWPFFHPSLAAQSGPRSLQDESKIVLDRLFVLFDFRFNF